MTAGSPVMEHREADDSSSCDTCSARGLALVGIVRIGAYDPPEAYPSDVCIACLRRALAMALDRDGPRTVAVKAAKIVDLIVLDLTYRRGLRQVWDGIDPDTRDEIVAAWIAMAGGVIEGDLGYVSPCEQSAYTLPPEFVEAVRIEDERLRGLGVGRVEIDGRNVIAWATPGGPMPSHLGEAYNWMSESWAPPLGSTLHRTMRPEFVADMARRVSNPDGMGDAVEEW